MITNSKKKVTAILFVRSNEHKIDDVLDAEEEMVLDRYPSTIVSRDSGRRIYHIPFTEESVSSPLPRGTSKNKNKRHSSVIISLGPRYPYESPSISIEMAQPLSEKGKEYMQDAHILTLSKEIEETIAPSLDIGVGVVQQIIQIVEESYLNFNPNNSSPRIPSPASGRKCVVGHPNNEKGSPTASKPSSTPVPLKERDGIRLSVFASHLLKKCCFLRHPESVEEASTIFMQLHQYFLNEKHLIPYKSKVFPWSSEKMEELRDVIESSSRDDGVPSELLSWLWKIPTGVSTTHASSGRYHQEFIEKKLLGFGGFGAVFLCRKKLDGRTFAIKKVVMHKKETEKVLREVAMLANLNHKNVVAYLDCWVEEGYSEDLRKFVDALEEESKDDEETEEEKKDDDYDSTSSFSSSFKKSSSNTSSERSYFTSDDDVASDDEKTSPMFLTEKESEAQRKVNYQTLYIQMELCSTITLRGLLNGDGRGNNVFRSPEGIKTASAIFRQLLGVIADTHERSIVHRDLKPENILFNASQTDPLCITDTSIRVVDFGLAKEIKCSPYSLVNAASRSFAGDENHTHRMGDNFSDSSPHSECFGTILYSAPELASSGSRRIANPDKVDEFSIGMIALEMWLSISGTDMRETAAIMEEVWINPNAGLPPWFLQIHPEIAKIILSLVSHDDSKRMPCKEVLQHSFPGDSPELVGALQTIDRFGADIVHAVIHHVSHLEFQKRELSDKETFFYKEMSSSQWLHLISVSEMVARVHGYATVSLPCHLPMNKDTRDYVVDSNGRSYLYSPFPHYAIANFLFSLEPAHDVSSLYSLYCKNKPYMTFTTPFFGPERHLSQYVEPFCSFFHLLSCTKASGVVRIILSHTRWMEITAPLKGMYESVGGRSVGMDSPPFLRKKMVPPSSWTASPNSPSVKAEDDTELKSLLAEGSSSCPFPNFRKTASMTESLCDDDRFPFYAAQMSQTFSEAIQILDADIQNNFSVSLVEGEEKSLEEAEGLFYGLKVSYEAFEKYLPGFKIEIVLKPFFEPPKDVIDRDILLSEGVIVAFVVEREIKPNRKKNSTASPGPPKFSPLAFGCCINSTITQLSSPAHTPPNGTPVRPFTKPISPTVDRRSAFVFSIDGLEFCKIFSSPPLSLWTSFVSLDGVGLRTNDRNTKQAVEVAATLWMSNHSAFLGYKEEKKTSSLLSTKNTRYVFNNGVGVTYTTGKNVPLLKKQTINDKNACNLFFSLVTDELHQKYGEENFKKDEVSPSDDKNDQNLCGEGKNGKDNHKRGKYISKKSLRKMPSKVKMSTLYATKKNK